MKKIVKLMGINNFMAAKNDYCRCIGCNGGVFYNRLKTQLQYFTPKQIAEKLRNNLLFHTKEFAQYQ